MEGKGNTPESSSAWISKTVTFRTSFVCSQTLAGSISSFSPALPEGSHWCSPRSRGIRHWISSLKSHRLGYVVEGNVIRIAPLTELAQEEADRRRLAEEQALAGDLKTMIRELSYAKAGDVQSLVQRNLSARGDIAIDVRTNTVIITDLSERLDTIDSLIDTLDAPIPGVEIAARIIVTTRIFSRNLGIQWGFSGHTDAAFGNSNELTFPNSVLIDGQSIGSEVDQEFRAPAPRNPGLLPPVIGADEAQRGYAVNLPIPIAPTGAIGLALGSISGAFSIDVALAAAESRGEVRIISSPKIITQNNKAAEIKQGITFPVQVVANNTVTVTFKEAVLELLVTPTDHVVGYHHSRHRGQQRHRRLRSCSERHSEHYHAVRDDAGSGRGWIHDRHWRRLRQHPKHRRTIRALAP